MPDWKRLRQGLVAGLSAALVLSILAPVSPWATAQPWERQTLQLQAPRELLVGGAPFSLDCDLVLFPSRVLQGKLQTNTRQQQAVIQPRLDPQPATYLESPSATHLPKLYWWKNRRYVCQMLDLPPPSSTPSCAL